MHKVAHILGDRSSFCVLVSNDTKISQTRRACRGLLRPQCAGPVPESQQHAGNSLAHAPIEVLRMCVHA